MTESFLETQEADEIKASISKNILEEAPSPSEISTNEVSTGELHEVQGYQPYILPKPVTSAHGSSPFLSVLPQRSAVLPELVGRTDIDKIQRLAESIIHEKWEEFNNKVGNIEVWKEKTETNINSLKQELIRTQQRFENLEKAVLHKVADYNETMESVNTEMKALEKVFEKIIEPLTSSIKELKKITKDLKK